MAIKILSKYIIHQATIYKNVNYLKSTQIIQQMVFWPLCHIFPDPIIWPNYLNRLQMIISKSGKIKSFNFCN